ncbi:TonB-dependent receptor plug domain-containing protein [Cellvibrio mixtus]|uniref:TonB-dependent receptor plug domain-containing protein n=1 Tax=Cellvibrio mixtus TaxID=39650 RepID=UPI000586ACE3|nr:TonB-dependent receptor [Cellvibrio mixtus]
MGNRKFFHAGILVLAVCCASVSYADDNDIAYLELNLEELLEVPVTGATMTEESLKTVPSVVTVFTREQIDRLGLDYLYELLRLVPGFQVSRNADNPFNYTYSSGGRRLGNRALEILLVVDGRLFGNPRAVGADTGISLFPLAQIERVEVIQGPGSALYGSGAYTGVINIISRHGETSVKAALGSDNRHQLDWHWSGQVDDWQSNIFFHAYGDDGQTYHLADGRTTDDPRRELDIDIDVHDDSRRLQAAWYRLEGDDFYTLEKVLNDFNEYRQQFRHLSLEQTFEPADNWHTKLTLAYRDGEQHFHAPLTAAGELLAASRPGSSEPMLAKVTFNARATQLTFANEIDLAAQGNVQFGLDWQRAEEDETRGRTNYNLEQLVARQRVDYYGNFDYSAAVEKAISRETAGLYGQWIYDLGKATRMTLGGRYDYYEGIGDHISPRLGLVHQLNTIHSIKLLYGEAFRAPNFVEVALLNNPFLVGNPDLDHELVKTWNLAWIATGKRTSMELAGFISRYENPILTAFQGSARAYINGEDQEAQGASLDVNYQLNARWLLRASYTHLYDLPDSAFAEAEHLASAVVNYQHGRWNWNLSASYQGPRNYLITLNQQGYLEGYWLANGQVSYNFNTQTKLRLSLKNLLDESYSSPALGVGIRGGVPNRGREASIGMDWQF